MSGASSSGDAIISGKLETLQVPTICPEAQVSQILRDKDGI